MILEEAIKRAKGDEEEKVGISLKIYTSLKDRLTSVAKANSVSVNSLISSILEEALKPGKKVDKEIYLELNELEQKLSKFLLHEDQGGEPFNGFMCNPGSIDNYEDELRTLTSRVNSLRKALGV